MVNNFCPSPSELEDIADSFAARITTEISVAVYTIIFFFLHKNWIYFYPFFYVIAEIHKWRYSTIRNDFSTSCKPFLSGKVNSFSTSRNTHGIPECKQKQNNFLDEFSIN